MLLIIELWFMLILSCSAFTKVAWIVDEVWTTDELLVVAREWEISSWCFFSNFSSNVFITLSFLSNWFFKVETWSCGYINVTSLPLYSRRINFRGSIFFGSNSFIMKLLKHCFKSSLPVVYMSLIWFYFGIDRQVLYA